ncbi:thiamine phosphate synthase [Campylobacter sp. VTCC 70190]|uniref:thiamine phosphate synthase n=1 Tax=Campylobacter sp. VTCC 70190 TaxID=3392118 RepID=UPI00398F7387
MWAKKIIAISDRSCAQGDFLKQLERLVRAGVDGIVLREKDLSEDEYFSLAKEVLALCAKTKTTCFLHFFTRVGLKLGHPYFHAPLALLRTEPNLRRYFKLLGTSIHSQEELLEALNFKLNYAFVGHIFESSCKLGLEPKGLDFLSSLLQNHSLPLYAIGGIRAENLELLKDFDLAGICMREVLMREKNPRSYLLKCRQKLC